MGSTLNCDRCGYDRTGITRGARCPECGAPSPVPGGGDFDTASPRAIAIGAILFGIITLGQILSLALVVSVFAREPVQPWLVLGGTIIGVGTCLIRMNGRLRSTKDRVSGKSLVGVLMLALTVFTTIFWLAVPAAGEWSVFFYSQLLPVLGCTGLVIGARAAVNSARWVGDARGRRFLEYSIWPPAICLVVGIALGGGLETGARVTLISIGFIGWWVIQLIGDVLVMIHTTLLIAHRVQLDGIEARRADRESEWLDDLPYPRDS